MKKYIVILLVVGLIAAFIVPYFKGSGVDDITESPCKFGFTENLAVKFGGDLPIPIEISGDVATLELSFGQKKVKTWTNPTGKVTFTINTKDYQPGAFALEITGKTKSGQTILDQRLVRILSDITPEKWSVEMLQTYPHAATSFTQGLEFNDGKLFEGTGDPNQDGSTIVAEVDLKSGAILKKMGLDASHFGEGITVFGDKIYQLTWKNQKCLVYNKSDLVSVKEFNYTGEGWGLCNDGKSLIMSDGSERIYFRNPETFDIEKTIEVYTDQGPVTRLNELEYVDGLVYANIWTSNNIAVFEANTGRVIAIIDATNVVREGQGNGEVLNGIAFNPKANKWYITGKMWPKLFEVKWLKKAAA